MQKQNFLTSQMRPLDKHLYLIRSMVLRLFVEWYTLWRVELKDSNSSKIKEYFHYFGSVSSCFVIQHLKVIPLSNYQEIDHFLIPFVFIFPCTFQIHCIIKLFSLNITLLFKSCLLKSEHIYTLSTRWRWKPTSPLYPKAGEK